MKNIAASVRARLANIGQAEGMALDFMIERFAIGRLLWRISQSPHADRFVLKGAQLFAMWEQNPHRPTRDIDFLSFGDPAEKAMESLFIELLAAPADPEDGMIWGKPSVGQIRDDQSYGGIRIAVPVMLAGARVRIQIDIGFGDTVTPGTEEQTWHELLGYPAAKINTYPPETVIAEKLEAAVQLDIANTRMKDFYDLDWLAAHRSFDFEILHRAITRTFTNRQTELPSEAPFVLTEAFSLDSGKQTQWDVFLRKNRLAADPLDQVIGRLRDFLLPVILEMPSPVQKIWSVYTGWTQNNL
ncbi:MAG: nucleotidyl transferase AbiEii/AbiGii toxin family protein [Verrucomicrobiaceae bacterium]|nr:nucleotidyl transferase AbiEii/AbiGii toxin family protein [Verrucomicrobiaceae bacterium]